MHSAIETQGETYLSDYVHLVLVRYGFRRPNIITSKSNCIEWSDILFDWTFVESSFKGIRDDLDVCNQCEDWYLDKIETVWEAIHSAGSAVNASNSCDRERLYQLAGWVCDPSLLAEFNQSIEEKDDSTNILLAILHMTAAFERALRKLYLMKNSPAPFLLRDLLKSDEISHTFGKIPTLFTQLILGCPRGLNLRNVAWHGFVSPGELHSDLVSGLIVLFASLRRSLTADLVPGQFSSLVNTFENFKNDLCEIFPDLRSRQSEVLHVLESSVHINKRFLIYWKKVYSLFLLNRFGDCIVLLMPQLEHCLRVRFCKVNNCPTRLLTAESTSLYTTLDEILAPSPKPVVGEGLMMMLLDLTASMSGPRLRDKLSHGEFEVASIPGWFANHVLALALCVTCHKVSCGVSLCSELETAASLYQSKFHVFTTLYQMTDSLLSHWDELQSCSKPPVDLQQLDSCSCGNISALDAFLFPKIKLISDKVSKAREILSKNKPPTLFRPRSELEIATGLVTVVRCVDETLKTIQSTVSQFEQKRMAKTLRSRSRQTAIRMYSVLPDLFSALLTLLFTLSVFYNHLSTLTQVKDIQRLVKSMTKVVENTVVLCNIERNRWMEAHQLASSLASEIHSFLLLIKDNFDVSYL